ncbi:MAG TPA: hypothetical protein VH302_16415 [Bryobacteraceae bacterium]|nr:hypothetical protein [Bryobacteraceae bacterium]
MALSFAANAKAADTQNKAEAARERYIKILTPLYVSRDWKFPNSL